MLNTVERCGLQTEKKINLTGGKCVTRYRQIKGEDRSCRAVHFGNMTEQLQPDFPYMYEGIGQFDESIATITHLGKVNI